jgi:choline-sulfatase
MALRDYPEGEESRGLMATARQALTMLDEALRLPEGVSAEDFFDRYCPPIPENFEPQVGEPEIVSATLALRPFRKHARDTWDENRWRLHRWAYARLVERVDAQVGRLLAALRGSGRAEDTVVIFTSDHGEMDSAHRMDHKTVLYEEAVGVPLIISDPKGARAGGVDSHLVSNGLDLVPTVCDYAGVEIPRDLAGRSLRPLVEGRPPEDWREWLPVESDVGAAVVGDAVKYAIHDHGENREQLVDLRSDPGETRNVAGEADHRVALEACREACAGLFPDWPPVPSGVPARSRLEKAGRP